jgi:hypothetical protein
MKTIDVVIEGLNLVIDDNVIREEMHRPLPIDLIEKLGLEEFNCDDEDRGQLFWYEIK